MKIKNLTHPSISRETGWPLHSISDAFARQKDDSFKSSINQIKQGYGHVEFYPSLEEKAANLLYFITKNHSLADGNKRIAAACFLY